MPSATRMSPSWTRWRVLSDTDRTVPTISHESGITLLVVPAWMLATVTTVGSNTSTLRVTMVWMACTISQAIGTGSRVRWGSEAWPPAPFTLMRRVSDDAMIGPRRVLTHPLGSAVVMWMAAAAETGLGVPSANGGTSSRPSSSMYRAP